MIDASFMLIIEIIFIIILIFIRIDINKKLRKDYLNDIEIGNFGIQRIFVLISPSQYFKRKTFWEGYFLYLMGELTLVAIVLIIALIFKLI